jgi:hypothetical protein
VLAEHYECGGAKAMAFFYQVRAAEHSLRLNAFTEAERYLDLAGRNATSYQTL